MRRPLTFRALTAGPGPVPAGADVSGIAAHLALHPAIPGAVAGWTTAGRHALAVAGLRRQGGGAAVEPGDRWHIGSLTKSMTATLAARMVEARAIDRDATVGATLGASFDMDDAWRDATLVSFLRHASGMRANIGLAGRLRVGRGPRADYVARVLAQRPRGPRGGFLYSNAGYVVAGAMLEAAGRAPWEDLVARDVFAPLGLASAGFGAPAGAGPRGHRLTPFGGLRPVAPGPRADNIPALGPAGRVHVSGGDMLRYLRAHLLGEGPFLSRESWGRLHRAEGPGRYAQGWAEVDGVLRHSGSNGYWFAQMRLCRAGGAAAFVAVNAAAMGLVRRPVEAAADAVLADALRAARGGG
ncbi:serine hydrolase [Roseibacterium sp. SDUM158017]|uniref:serine hydrolase domain-containing protein n=1 Tax=Roseicyclus salinarum TaxID=3036773 RepID=UPI0024151C8D|nr:serine hydrolase [Roseibacterium sp. SDUM158017]MDG4648266.1 serine hydrolase [Roseibacterium sp. SDUM158017]